MKAVKIFIVLVCLTGIIGAMAGCGSWEGIGVGKKITPGAKSLNKSALKGYNDCSYRCERERIAAESGCRNKLEWVPPLDLPKDMRKPYMREPWGYTPESIAAYYECISEAFERYASCLNDCDANYLEVGECYSRCMRTCGDAALCLALCEASMER